MNKQNQIFRYEKVSKLKIFISQFKSPLIYILLFAALLTLFINKYVDTVVILVTLLINTFLGFYQEFRAQNTLFHLRALLKPLAIIIRDGKRREIDAEEIQVGDIALVSKELSIPADGILVEGKDIYVNESLLTGEFFPVKKEIGDTLYVGTIITSGLGKIKIEHVGLNTKIGEIGKHILVQKEKITPLQKQISDLSKKITIILAIVSVLIFIVGYINKYELITLLQTVVSLIVASIPEGLVITMTVVLTVGMQKILKQNAIVRRLVAAETLGSVDIICVDKTGTLTEGKLSTANIKFNDVEMGLASSLLCNNLVDPIEVALNDWYQSEYKDKLSPDLIKQLEKSERLDTIPFANEHKFTATLNKLNTQNIIFTFGAPESVLKHCKISAEEKEKVLLDLDLEGKNARKVIGFSYKYFDKSNMHLDDIHSMTWNGFISFEDPVRPNIDKTIQTLATAGITVKMITGDFIHTAISVAKSIGLIESMSDEDMRKYVLSGEQLTKMNDEEIKYAVEKCKLFVRINPNQKLKIVETLKSLGHVVAMTGDGINDAPALKKADVGVVVNEASDISKNTADVVLLNSDLKTIAYAVNIGRVIYDNIRKVIVYLLSGSLAEIVLLLSALTLSLPSPLTPLQILFINLVEDTFPALALAYEGGEKGIMNRKPLGVKTKILSRKFVKMIMNFIIVSNVTLLAFYYILISTVSDTRIAQTVIFVAFGIKSLLYVYSIKHLNTTIFSKVVFSNWRLNLAVLFGLMLNLAVLNIEFLREIFSVVNIGFEYILIAFSLGVINIIIMEIVKKKYIINQDN